MNDIITNSDSTICAISTPQGIGGIAVVRISGPQAIDVTSKIWQGKNPKTWTSHTAHLGNIIDPADNSIVDQAVATLFRAPNSFTGQDTIELSVHGSTFIQSETLRLLIDAGAQMAQPGEFTRRAFASGRLDLVEAEAVADLIASTTKGAHHVAMNQMRGHFSDSLSQLRQQLIDLTSLLELELDFSEEEVEFASRTQLLDIANDIAGRIDRLTVSFATGQALRHGIPVAIVGATNAGKSTLLNTIVGDERAIVSDIHGTTRDTIEDTITINHTLFRFIDTAGLRDTADPIERIGIERTLAKATQARIVIWMIDPQLQLDIIEQTLQTLLPHVADDALLIAAVNKIDIADPSILIDRLNSLLPSGAITVAISARTAEGSAPLLDAISRHAQTLSASANQVLVTNIRHYEALVAARKSLQRTIDGLTANLSGDFIAQDLRETIHHLGTITGTITTTDILQTIFTRFCVGK